jgi:hypothetical protein
MRWSRIATATYTLRNGVVVTAGSPTVEYWSHRNRLSPVPVAPALVWVGDAQNLMDRSPAT